MRERQVERHLRHMVEAHGGTTRKFVSPGRRGVADRIVIWPRRINSIVVCAAIHFIETKRPGERAKAHQAREHKRLRALGCTVLVVDTIQKVDDYVRIYS